MTAPTTPEKRRRDGKAKFLALRETIFREAAEGHTIRAIYDRHFDPAALSYSQFARHFARHVRTNDGPDTKASTPAAAPQEPRAVTPEPVERKPDPGPDPIGQPGFRHTAKPDRSKLI